MMTQEAEAKLALGLNKGLFFSILNCVHFRTPIDYKSKCRLDMRTYINWWIYGVGNFLINGNQKNDFTFTHFMHQSMGRPMRHSQKL